MARPDLMTVIDAEPSIEAIAEAAHAAWAAEKVRQGFADHAWPPDWREGAKHGDVCQVRAAHHHPHMWPYADLTESVQASERATVRTMLAAIDAAGYTVTRRQD